VKIWPDVYTFLIVFVMDEAEDFIVRFSALVGPGSLVLDVAAGRGRHALLFAHQACAVVAMETNREFIGDLQQTAFTERLDVEVIEADVERMSLLPSSFDVIVNTCFLYRPLFSHYIAALRPGGLLFFRTFTTDNVDVLGHCGPRRTYLLEPRELSDCFCDLEIIHYEESVTLNRAMATLVARK
jgi:SAM-dependent methyltransferase